MRNLFLLAVAACVASSASGSTLTFNPGAACGAVACASGALIGQGYGDNTFVDVSYSSRSGFGNSPIAEATLHYGGAGYGDLTGVAYAGPNASNVIEIKFTPLQGATFSLKAFDIGGSLFSDRFTTVRIYDLDYTLLLDYSTIAPGDGHNAQNFIAYDFPNGLVIQVGDDGHNVGIDNVTYTALENGTEVGVGGVPEPSMWMMMIAGFGLVGGGLRSRSHRTSRPRVAFSN